MLVGRVIIRVYRWQHEKIVWGEKGGDGRDVRYGLNGRYERYERRVGLRELKASRRCLAAAKASVRQRVTRVVA